MGKPRGGPFGAWTPGDRIMKNYRRPYNVRWLCRKHHSRLHRTPVDTPLTEAAAIRALKDAT